MWSADSNQALDKSGYYFGTASEAVVYLGARRESVDMTLDRALVVRAAVQYLRLQDREENPSGTFDDGGRWYPDAGEAQQCCQGIRQPSRSYPYSLMTHCRSVEHVALREGVDRTAMQRVARKLKRYVMPTLSNMAYRVSAAHLFLAYVLSSHLSPLRGKSAYEEASEHIAFYAQIAPLATGQMSTGQAVATLEHVIADWYRRIFSTPAWHRPAARKSVGSSGAPATTQNELVECIRAGVSTLSRGFAGVEALLDAMPHELPSGSVSTIESRLVCVDGDWCYDDEDDAPHQLTLDEARLGMDADAYEALAHDRCRVTPLTSRMEYDAVLAKYGTPEQLQSRLETTLRSRGFTDYDIALVRLSHSVDATDYTYVSGGAILIYEYQYELASRVWRTRSVAAYILTRRADDRANNAVRGHVTLTRLENYYRRMSPHAILDGFKRKATATTPAGYEYSPNVMFGLDRSPVSRRAYMSDPNTLKADDGTYESDIERVLQQYYGTFSGRSYSEYEIRHAAAIINNRTYLWPDEKVAVGL